MSDFEEKERKKERRKEGRQKRRRKKKNPQPPRTTGEKRIQWSRTDLVRCLARECRELNRRFGRRKDETNAFVIARPE